MQSLINENQKTSELDAQEIVTHEDTKSNRKLIIISIVIASTLTFLVFLALFCTLTNQRATQVSKKNINIQKQILPPSNSETLITTESDNLINDLILTPSESLNVLYFKDQNDNLHKTFTANEIDGSKDNEYDIFEILNWNETTGVLWGHFFFGPTPISYFTINTRNWKITNYDITQLDRGPETVLNISNGIVVFSNYPALYEQYDAEEYLASRAEVTLSTYNLKTKEIKPISTSITKPFNPVWVNENIIEYDDPNGESRMQYILN